MSRRRFALPAAIGVIAIAAVFGISALGSGFTETFDGTPSTPQDYTNPHNWDIMTFGVDSRQPNLAQHGPNCEPPGFPYSSSNTHPIHTASNAVFLCGGGANTHLMTSLGITGYGAVYMTPPAVADFSQGPASIRWDMSTLRTSARDWVYVTITPFAEHHEMPYLNTDQHIPPHNIKIALGGANVFLLYQNGGFDNSRLGQQDDYHRWDDVFAAQAPPVSASPIRRDTFEITLDRNSISLCMPQYRGFGGDPVFCWAKRVPLREPLDPAVWGNQATVQWTHVTYNAEKSCEDGALAAGIEPLDQYNIVHNSYGDANCPPNTWHWDNVSISPAVAYSVIQSAPPDAGTHDGAPSTIAFAQAAPAGSFLSFVAFSDTPRLRVSFDSGATWVVPHFQEATSFAHPEVGENIFMPIPAGQRSVMVRGANGYWGSFSAFAFKIVSPPGDTPPPPAATATPIATAVIQAPTPSPASTATQVPSSTPTATARATSTVAPSSTATPTAAATAAPTATATPTAVPVPICAVRATLNGVDQLFTRPASFCTDQ